MRSSRRGASATSSEENAFEANKTILLFSLFPPFFISLYYHEREKNDRGGAHHHPTVLFFVEATSHSLGNCDQLWRVSLPLDFRLPVTRSVGLKVRGGPGVLKPEAAAVAP